jgi:hypothetical protein
MSQAAFWESIAAPDVRLQTAALARRLTGCALEREDDAIHWQSIA